MVQVQHEQQLLAAKQEQQQLLQDAKRQVESLQQQLQDLRQQAVQQVGPLVVCAACMQQLQWDCKSEVNVAPCSKCSCTSCAP